MRLHSLPVKRGLVLQRCNCTRQPALVGMRSYRSKSKLLLLHFLFPPVEPKNEAQSGAVLTVEVLKYTTEFSLNEERARSPE